MDKRIKIKIKFEPRDVWIGLYWNIEKWAKYEFVNGRDEETMTGQHHLLRLYFCIIPLFPIIVSKQLD